ncbi:MAG: cytochrome c oxidase subunit II [Acidobacteria bacterium]|nr:cytochrome c oxidase subunit II [Acidobacteriota bacterium]MCW5949571.1 cytochrome c oxidase subunit II [Pyrinomonadaceae bacterium]
MQNTSWVPFFPEQASTVAGMVDALYFYLILVSVAFSIPVVVGIFVFAIKYRAKEKFATPEEIHGSMVLESVWSFIPFVVSMTIFVGGALVYFYQYTMPENAMEIYVVGKQWMWKAQHGTGQREINELHIPVNTPIKLTMATEDVLHDFDIPAFRTKADVVPGRYTYLWFNATKPGKYHLYCAEYCGLNHSGMGGWVYVMERRDFDNWLAGNASGQTPVEIGKDLFEAKLSCASCHAGGPQQRGAKLEGLYGSTVKLVGGGTVTADDDYIRNSIINPAGQVVEGYQPIMPSFKGQVTEEQLTALVAYVKSLTPNAASAPAAPAASGGPAQMPAANAAAAPKGGK